MKDEGKTENENTPPPNEGSGDKTTPAQQHQNSQEQHQSFQSVTVHFKIV